MWEGVWILTLFHHRSPPSCSAPTFKTIRQDPAVDSHADLLDRWSGLATRSSADISADVSCMVGAYRGFQKLIRPNTCEDYRFIELFAGSGNVTKALRMAGFPGLAMDLVYCDAYDFLSLAGFVLSLIGILKLQDEGLVVLAPVCSSFSSMSRATSQRSPNNPLGDSYKQFVRDGNIIGSRVVLAMYLIEALGHVYLLEQPGGSTFPLLPRFQTFRFGVGRMIKVPFWMCLHGSATAKRTVIFSNCLAAKTLDLGTLTKDLFLRGFIFMKLSPTNPDPFAIRTPCMKKPSCLV